MRTRTFILVAGFVAALLVLAGGAVAYDHSHRDTIARGITVGGIDVGGLTRAEATARLQSELLAPLRQPVIVDHGSHRWTLTAREAKVSANIEATVDEAVARSREGNILARTARGLTGGRVAARLQPQITYSDAAIVRLLDRVRTTINRPSMNATLQYTLAGPKATRSKVGLAVKTKVLHARIRALLRSTAAKRRVGATTVRVAPKVTSASLAKQAPTVLVVNRGAFTLSLYQHFKKTRSYSVAIGAVGLDTPAGLYHIQNKAVNPAWTEPNSSWVAAADRGKVVPGGTAANPLKARWMGIFNGAGIHGVDPSEYGSIGHAASHGCVRMRIPDVIDLYPHVPVGTPIYIA